MTSLKDISRMGAVVLALDMITAIMCAVYYLDPDIHIAFRCVLGFAFGALVIGLLSMPYIKGVAKLACGVALPFVISDLTDKVFGSGLGAVREKSDIAWWTIIGAAAILFVILHFVGLKPEMRYADEAEFDADELDEHDDCYERMDEIMESYNSALDRFEVLAESVTESGFLDESAELCAAYDAAMDMWLNAGGRLDSLSARLDRQSGADRYATIRESEAYLAKLLRLKKALEDSYNEMKQQDREQQGDADEYSFFRGCDSIAALNKRYKSLAKVYHPDTGNGDTETMAAINAEFKRLKARLD